MTPVPYGHAHRWGGSPRTGLRCSGGSRCEALCPCGFPGMKECLSRRWTEQKLRILEKLKLFFQSTSDNTVQGVCHCTNGWVSPAWLLRNHLWQGTALSGLGALNSNQILWSFSSTEFIIARKCFRHVCFILPLILCWNIKVYLFWKVWTISEDAHIIHTANHNQQSE